MKLVIDIDDKLYEDSKKLVEYGFGSLPYVGAIKNGIPYKERSIDRWGKWVIIEIQCPNCLEFFLTDCYSEEELRDCPFCHTKLRGGET